MAVYASNGATFYICETAQASEPANAAAYQALTWVKVGELESLGTFGDTSNEISWATLEDPRVRRFKGTRNAGTLEIVCGRDYGDDGQTAILTAEESDDEFAFKVLFNDAPSGGTPSERYFVAVVGAATETVDTADNIVKLNATLWINSKITRVAASS